MKSFAGCQLGGPQNGTQAHDLSRELEFDRPAQVGATPFWEPPAWQPTAHKRTKIRPPLQGGEMEEEQPTETTHKCYPCIDPNVLPMS